MEEAHAGQHPGRRRTAKEKATREKVMWTEMWAARHSRDISKGQQVNREATGRQQVQGNSAVGEN